MTESEAELADLRQRIDTIDNKIVALLHDRARCAHQVGRVKAAATPAGEAVLTYRPEREAAILRRVSQVVADGLPAAAVTAVYEQIIGACRNLQRPLRVSYLGPAGTYSEEAARAYFGATSQLEPADDLDRAVALAETGEADCALLPLENSTEGAVGRTLDLLRTTPLRITGEYVLPVHHQLLSQAADLSAVSRVCAHPQALAQCRRWLDRHMPAAERLAVASNAAACQLAAADNTLAAIAGQRAAQQYKLPVRAAHIQDEAQNATRFVVLGSTDPGPSGNDRTSLVCTLVEQAGSLQTLLAVFAGRGINLTKLESRPLPGSQWRYQFFIDLDGHAREPELAAALAEAVKLAPDCKVLGSYPKAVLLA